MKYATAIQLRVITYDKETKEQPHLPTEQQAAIDLHVNRKVSDMLNELSEEVSLLVEAVVRLKEKEDNQDTE